MASNLVTLTRNLQQRKGRKRRGLAVAEGIRLVEDALASGVEFRGVVVSSALQSHPRGAALLEQLASRAIPSEEVSERELRELADTDTPQGILAVITPRRSLLTDLVPHAQLPVLVIDGVQDPGNVGALLRTAHALGSPCAILLRGTADPTSPKVLRGAMGASFRLAHAFATDGELAAWLRQHEVTLWAADADGASLQRLDPVERLAIVVGNEGIGVRDEIAALAQRRVAIPLARGAESLNVAVAAGILLYEVQRAR